MFFYILIVNKILFVSCQWLRILHVIFSCEGIDLLERTPELCVCARALLIKSEVETALL